MNHGDFVLNLLKEVPKTGKTIVLIRHSERNSFKGIPDNLREGVEITMDGIHMARAFGESLGQIFPGKRMLLGHTAAHRCKMTAESISDGYSSSGDVQLLGCLPDVKSVVANPDKYIELREEFGWQCLMQKWLELEITEQTLENPQKYCDNLLGSLVSFSEMNDNDLLVVIAHDVTIFPIIFSVFGKPVTSINFLNGVVITGDSTTFKIQYADADHSLKAEWSNL